MNILKQIAEKKFDDYLHNKFKRFGRGEFDRFFVAIKVTSKNLKLKASYDLAVDLIGLISNYIKEDVQVKGKILANVDFEDDLPIETKLYKKKSRLYLAEVDTVINPSTLKKLFELFKNQYLLLNLTSPEVKLKVGKSLPKPGKDLKPDFCKATLPKEMLKEFLFDLDDLDVKDVVIINRLSITDLKIPEEFKDDPAKARIEAKRIGVLHREITVDGRKILKEYPFTI